MHAISVSSANSDEPQIVTIDDSPRPSVTKITDWSLQKKGTDTRPISFPSSQPDLLIPKEDPSEISFLPPKQEHHPNHLFPFTKTPKATLLSTTLFAHQALNLRTLRKTSIPRRLIIKQFL
jgi:hypothetical protein